MIDRDGTVKIIDLASAHVAGLAESAGMRDALAIVGTLQYTAPEYFVGHAGSVRSDLFSLAVVAYQMLAGQLPYGLYASRVRSPADVNRLRYVPLRHFRPDLAAWVDAVLQRHCIPILQGDSKPCLSSHMTFVPRGESSCTREPCRSSSGIRVFGNTARFC